MKETKHTPGPWELGEPTSQLEFGVYATDKISGIRYFLANAEGHMRYKESLANARLIAAAPELLEALRMWLDIHETPAGFAGKYGKALDDALAAQQLKVDAAASAARAAIAKATGGAA